LIDENGGVVGTWRYPTEPDVVECGLLFDSATGHFSVMYRAEVVRALGGYAHDYEPADDYDLCSRMSER
jgi:hypothetical protein